MSVNDCTIDVTFQTKLWCLLPMIKYVAKNTVCKVTDKKIQTLTTGI